MPENITSLNYYTSTHLNLLALVMSVVQYISKITKCDYPLFVNSVSEKLSATLTTIIIWYWD